MLRVCRRHEEKQEKQGEEAHREIDTGHTGRPKIRTGGSFAKPPVRKPSKLTGAYRTLVEQEPQPYEALTLWPGFQPRKKYSSEVGV